MFSIILILIERRLTMQFKSFCKNQREVAQTINDVIDSYWNANTSEQDMIAIIKKIYENNADKIIKEGEFTKVLQQQCGKKRLDVISKIIEVK